MRQSCEIALRGEMCYVEDVGVQENVRNTAGVGAPEGQTAYSARNVPVKF